MSEFSIFDRISPPTTIERTSTTSWRIIHGMPRIDDAFVNSVIYIYSLKKMAESDESFFGSGFLLSVPLKHNKDYCVIYAVTNWHVIQSIVNQPFFKLLKEITIRITDKEGNIIYKSTKLEQWKDYADKKDDLVIAVIETVLRGDKYNCIPLDSLVTEEFIKNFDIGAGDDVYMAGKFIYRNKSKSNLPALRKGIISSTVVEPILNSDTNILQDSFLIEEHSISGYSGSPILLVVENPDVRTKKINFETWGEDFFALHGKLLGVNWGHISIRESVKHMWRWVNCLEQLFLFLNSSRSFQHVQSNTGMMGVVPAWKIKKLLDSKDIAKEREKIDDDISKDRKVNRLSIDPN